MAENLLSMTDIQTLDKQIGMLTECKPLAEAEVKQLCDKVL
jgi:hypothetical protein